MPEGAEKGGWKWARKDTKQVLGGLLAVTMVSCAVCAAAVVAFGEVGDLSQEMIRATREALDAVGGAALPEALEQIIRFCEVESRHVGVVLREAPNALALLDPESAQAVLDASFRDFLVTPEGIEQQIECVNVLAGA